MSTEESQYAHDFLPQAATGWQHRGNGGVYAPIDASSNKSLPWSVLGALFGGIGFGISLGLCLLKPWETSDRAAQAELRSEFAQQIADARSEARTAGTDAAIWKNRVVGLEKTLEAQRNVRR